MIRVLTLILGLMFLLGCSSNLIDDYADKTPELKLEKFFQGELKAHGVVLDRSGAFQRSFTVKLIGNWQQENGQLKGKLDEWFVYDDGEEDTRTWLITKTAEGEYMGTANDVIGKANGHARGNALYWRYDLEIQYKGDPLVVTLDDWMYLVDENRLINRTEIIKFGFKVGEVLLSIEKV